MTDIPSGTKFSAIAPGNDDIHKRSSQINNLNPVYTVDDLKGAINPSVAVTGTEISFEHSEIYNTSDSPATGNLTNDLTDANLGIVQKIYHNAGTEPTVPAGWVLMGSGTYTVSTLNVIYAEWCGGTRVEYWIVGEA